MGDLEEAADEPGDTPRTGDKDWRFLGWKDSRTGDKDAPLDPTESLSNRSRNGDLEENRCEEFE